MNDTITIAKPERITIIKLLSTEEGGDFTCEYRGRLALTNKQLTTYGLPLELRRHLRSQPDLHQRLLRLTPAARAIATFELPEQESF
ncbi:MAG: hypothetical protein IJ841_06245 [Prevotella sp.]|nr:hypothetical protein [Prevotella sp.]